MDIFDLSQSMSNLGSSTSFMYRRADFPFFVLSIVVTGWRKLCDFVLAIIMLFCEIRSSFLQNRIDYEKEKRTVQKNDCDETLSFVQIGFAEGSNYIWQVFPLVVFNSSNIDRLQTRAIQSPLTNKRHVRGTDDSRGDNREFGNIQSIFWDISNNRE